MENSKSIDEAQIRTLIEDRAKAVRAKDINRTMSNVAPDLLSFDVVNPLQRIGADGSKNRAAQWFSSFKDQIGFEIRDLSISAGQDVAFSHSLNRYSGTTIDGTQIDMWVRATTCFRKIDGEWTITHEHQSVPFDPASGRASLELKP